MIGCRVAPEDDGRAEAARIPARQVVIAAGGIGGNLDIVRKEWPEDLGKPPKVYAETAIRQNKGAIAFYESGIYELAGERWRRLILDAAAYSGAGWLGLRMMGHARRVARTESEIAPSFAGWADEVFEQSRPDYALLAARDGPTLDELYPAADARFLRVRAARGWAVLLDSAMEGHKQFGSIRVGTIVDCLAPLEDAGTVIRAATRTLETRGVDLIVSNQLHAAWPHDIPPQARAESLALEQMAALYRAVKAQE